MIVRTVLRRLGRSDGGVATVEFAILAPAIFALLLGVIQVGIALQNYNALRGAAADITRNVMIQYATGNKLSNSQLEAYATGVARDAPYLLTSTMNLTITDAATPQVTGANEKTLSIEYQIPSILAPLGLKGPFISVTQSMFVTK